MPFQSFGERAKKLRAELDKKRRAKKKPIEPRPEPKPEPAEVLFRACAKDGGECTLIDNWVPGGGPICSKCGKEYE